MLLAPHDQRNCLARAYGAATVKGAGPQGANLSNELLTLAFQAEIKPRRMAADRKLTGSPK